MKRLPAVMLAILIGMMLTACAAPPAAQPTPPPEPATFEPIVITGSGSKTTPPFTVTTDEWVIDWSYVPKFEGAGFSFYVYPRGAPKGGYVEAMLSPEGTTVGSTYSYAGAGEYYIKVIASNAKSWVIVISPP